MGISRSAAGTLFVGGALALTMAAIAYPTMLGFQTTASQSSRVIANPPAARSPRPTGTSWSRCAPPGSGNCPPANWP